MASPTQAPAVNGTGWNNSDVTVDWHWTDAGSGVDLSNCAVSSVMSDEGTRTLVASCQDLAGNTGTASYGVKVDKTKPHVAIGSPLDLTVSPLGVLLSFSAGDEGSGLASPMVASLSDAGMFATISVSSGDSVNAAGVYTLTVSAQDNAGNTNTATVTFVVYDPSAGFVTGGGWLTSPVGACQLTPACAAVAGRATFAFVSKYAKGATVPAGSARFDFRDGNFAFESTSYQWLVVAGAKAQFKGVGTVDASGAYGFMLTVVDGALPGGGGSDKFRLKVWDISTGAVVYDNEFGSGDNTAPSIVVGGGSIAIHP